MKSIVVLLLIASIVASVPPPPQVGPRTEITFTAKRGPKIFKVYNPTTGATDTISIKCVAPPELVLPDDMDEIEKLRRRARALEGMYCSDD